MDVILLQSKRIGHGLNLIKHSYLLNEFKDRKICVEMNPYSNYVLGYVSDLRLHPGITYHNFGIPISISSDDPGLFGYKGVTMDWYLAAVNKIIL